MPNSLQSQRKLWNGRTIKASPAFASLDSDFKQSLLEKAPLRKFDDGAIICQSGSKANAIWSIEEGYVTIGNFLEDGGFRSVARYGPGDSFGEIAMLAEKSRANDVIAEGECALRWIEAKGLRDALDQDPIAMRTMISALSEQTQELLMQISEVQHGAPEVRIVRVLLNLHADIEIKEALKMGQQELANLTGLSRVTVSKCLADFEAEGIIERGYGTITVHDHEALTRLAHG